MENKEQKTSLQRKIINTTIVLLLLVGFPLLSWLYLRDGLTWRKEALAELGFYGEIPSVHMIYPGNDKVDRVDGKVCVVHLFGENPDLTEENRFILDTGERLFKQFGDNMHFRLVMVARDGTAEFITHKQMLPSADYATWVWTGAMGRWTTLLTNSYDSYLTSNKLSPDAEYYALTDTSGAIRRFYNALDEKEIGRMVEQIAILLPQE